jgi:hypothetical protein
LARAAKNLLSLGAPDCPVCTGQCPVRQAGLSKVAALGTSTTVYGYNSPDCPVCTGLSGGRSQANSSLSGILRRRTAIIHRTVRCAPDCPVSQRSAGPTVGRTICAGHVAEPTARRRHRTCPVRQRLSGCQRSTAPFMERNRAPDMSSVHRTVRCASRQKARLAFQDCSQRLLAALGL